MSRVAKAYWGSPITSEIDIIPTPGKLAREINESMVNETIKHLNFWCLQNGIEEVYEIRKSLTPWFQNICFDWSCNIISYCSKPTIVKKTKTESFLRQPSHLPTHKKTIHFQVLKESSPGIILQFQYSLKT